ncbi:aminotransferase class V-fold PLP-dependent enzyme [Nocardioides sp. HM23]|uniref:aminotransferase class V-fold PLP-dependent enzyme n=1 Tax=Nocardioides bizhenqiangii TaxID=3095076 RepID=UPI002ACA7FE0|nr:aminotransferase class V-fold PLP-dependent enzyme [Nocardioides sp. HM23]MDZ5620142.1 aminotransferase class V-fold PLP-dependent enzyme [Nocardioides sp. HM23]MDZ5623449.1 aminotransferase class V-fold PLP-dependent enzyme [Nocardioides sp. HM23]
MTVDLTDAQSNWDVDPGWLNTASFGLPPRAGWDALQEALEQWRSGRGIWEEWQQSADTGRASFARLVGVGVEDVFAGSTVSAAMALIAASIPDGSTVLVTDIEFASNVFPWAAHADRGVTVVAAPVERLVDRIADGIDVVAIGLVQSATGQVSDLAAVSAAARAAGALVIVDATQAVGWLPVDAGLTDACVAGTYKWLMTPRGATFGYVSPQLQELMSPLQSGWSAAVDDRYYGLEARLFEGARRYDQAPTWFTHVAAAPTLELVEAIGVEAIHRHDLALANAFRAGLGMAPGSSAIVSADVPGAEERFAAADIRASARSGRLRVSFHVYSTQADVDLALGALDGLISQQSV